MVDVILWTTFLLGALVFISKVARALSVALIATLAILAGLSSPSHALNFQELAAQKNQCVKGRYVVRSVVPAKRRKAVRALNQARSSRSESYAETKNFDDISIIEDVKNPPGEAGPEVETTRRSSYSQNKCKALTQNYRAAKRAGGKLVRRYKCECDVLMQVSLAPNDTYAGVQYSITEMHQEQGWEIATGDDGGAYGDFEDSPVVAVIDTGIDYNHQDLNDNMWVNDGEVPGNGIDDDGNGYVDDVHGINCITSSGDPMDDHGHGTHVAGTIGAEGNNNQGVVGVMWKTRLMALKFLSASGSGYGSDALECINYATKMKRDYGYPVVATNNSWGGGGFSSSLYNAIREAGLLNILFMAAAGNSGVNLDLPQYQFYPAEYDLPYVIAVASSDYNGRLSSFSNYGANSVDIGAPGSSIASCYPGNRYVYMSGTSMATPNATGVLVAIMNVARHLTALQARQLLFDTALDYQAFAGVTTTNRMVNLHQGLYEATTNPPAPSPTPPPATPTPEPTPTPPPVPTPTPDPFTANISGTIVDQHNQGIPGVRVTLETSTNSVVTVFTDANGNYQFSDQNGPFDYTLIASKQGYSQFALSASFRGSAVHDLTLQVLTRRLIGSIVDPAGNPIAGARVREAATGRTVYTNSRGEFTFPEIAFGTDYVLEGHRYGYRQYTTNEGQLIGPNEKRIIGFLEL